MVETRSTLPPHVVIFPVPAQGHINSMLKLAESLCLSGINVTFVNTQQNHSRQLSYGNLQSRFSQFPGFCFETVPDGLSDDQLHSPGSHSPEDFIEDAFNRIRTIIGPSFRELLTSDRFKFDARGPVSCIIADGMFSFAIDVAEELGIPSISFRTVSACCTWICFSATKLAENGDIPFKEDRSCITWLDKQPEKSVVYVSFGSIATVSQIQAELVEATKERGYTVDWAPQEEVLNHPAVGGFFTHSGWKSTMESMVAGVPMVCWPHLADQQINSRYVSEVWKIGIDMKDDCNRLTRRIDEINRKVAEMARKSVSRDGSSYHNFEALLEFIRKSC
ncbi:hypothetical protein MKX01_035835 [Papaver californicum]|nr:hypothetical protein MKX01_035835 [Papaver californicum]